ncbi:protein-methionine-sulfoxide reductase heme-binding subunit MsrQ [Entomobacter blattae]|uniref:Protein-methionine-sulfoxide reductase heme-binding subunit MsrQ n=1 Tax=Entomobacter blattae TaxID=2762277 RepID=A0A7H1NP19_9PROT|nr:protein-methionine-sulfoxide reductase heme-binding subunit MsrQ [Entomobacter blattae]QNT77529.1 Protein-methionine-sulfoxide reductase heme-binding subunit MsrQ [Entomobacter blattae]
MAWLSRIPNTPWIKLALYILGFIPALWYFYLGMVGGLGTDPIRTFEDKLGIWALRFLIASLCITPLRKLVHINLLRYRRIIGLLAFYYVLLHFTVYLTLDKRLDWSLILHEISTKPYLIIGAIAALLLLALAVTSNNRSMKKLGKNWRRLHTLVYPATIGVGIHFMLAVKSWPTNMLVYNFILLVLLAYRVVASATKAKPQPIQNR